MSKKGLSTLLTLIVLIFTVSKVCSLTIKDIEENLYWDYESYYVGQDGSRYYFWAGPSGGPQIKLDYARTPNIEEIVGYHITRFSSSGEWKYTSRVPIKRIIPSNGHYKIMEDEKGIIYLVYYDYSIDPTPLNYSCAFDSVGNLVWKSSIKMPAGYYPAGIFQKDNGAVLYFASGGGFTLFNFGDEKRNIKIILNSHDIFIKHKLSLPHLGQNWRVARISKNRFLVVAFKSSLDRDKLFNMKTIGDYIHIFSFVVDSEGEIQGSVNLDNAEGKAAIVEINRNSIGTTGYFRKFDYFRMPDSSLFFVFGVVPRWKEKEWKEANFLLYVVKFSKDGKLVPLKHTPEVLPLSSLPSGYRVKGFYFRGYLEMEYWDYAVDSLGNFYVKIRKYAFKRR